MKTEQLCRRNWQYVIENHHVAPQINEQKTIRWLVLDPNYLQSITFSSSNSFVFLWNYTTRRDIEIEMEECEEKNQEIQSEAYEAVFHKWMKWNAHSNIASRARCYLFQFIYTMNSVSTRRILSILKKEHEDVDIEVSFVSSIDIV